MYISTDQKARALRVGGTGSVVYCTSTRTPLDLLG